MITTQEAIDLENKYGAHNYHPLPVVIARARAYLSGTPKETDILISSRHTLLLIRDTAILI
jgi:hypothetical protein